MKTVKTPVRLRRVVRSVSAVGSAALLVAASAAAAQTVDPYRPGIPRYDQAGVDVATGQFSYPMPLFQPAAGSNWLGLTMQYNLNSGLSSDYSGALNLQVEEYAAGWNATMSFGNSSDYHEGRSGSVRARSGRGWLKFYNASGGEMPFPATWPGGLYQWIPAYVIWTNESGRQIRYSTDRPVPSRTSCPDCMGGGVYRLDTVTEPDGTALKYYYRDYPAGEPFNFNISRVQSITSTRGFQLKYEYQSDNYADYAGIYRKAFLVSRITQVHNGVEYCNPAADHCSFTQPWPFVSVTGDYLGGTFTDPSGGLYQFQATLSADTGTLRFRSPGATGYNVIYNVAKVGSYSYQGYLVTTNFSKRVASATINGNTWSYAYVNHWASSAVMNFDMTSTDALGGVHAYQSRGASTSGLVGPNVTQDTDELGRLRTYTWSRDRPTVIVNPEGDRYTTTYDDRGNVTALQHVSKSGTETLSQTFGFPLSTSQAAYLGPNFLTVCDQPATCNQPTHVIDANLGRTDWTYTAFGSIASEMKPAPTAGAARPLVLNTYVQKYESIRNSAGALVAAGAPIWLLASTTQCQTVAGGGTPTCDPAAPQVVTTFEYGAAGTVNSLLLRGQVVSDGSTALRTCFGYDTWGRRIRESRPGAGHVSCS